MTKTTVFFGDNDVSYIFSVLLSKTKKQKSQISFLVHNMFRSSGPDHMLKKTVFFCSLLIYTINVKVNFNVLFGDHKTFHFVRGQQPMCKRIASIAATSQEGRLRAIFAPLSES